MELQLKKIVIVVEREREVVQSEATSVRWLWFGITVNPLQANVTSVPLPQFLVELLYLFIIICLPLHDPPPSGGQSLLTF